MDAFDENDATNRQYLGKVTFSENADDPNYVKVKGLSSYLASNLDTKDDTFLAKYNGLVSPMPTTVIIDIKQNGLGYELKSKEVPYITRASGRNIEQFYLSVYREDNRDIKLDAILVKENIDENNYILYHYTTDEVLFATLYISDNTLKDIKLEFDDENLVKTRSLASWYQCANDEYQNYKDFYENNHPIACDIGDLFFGACTVGGVLGSAIYCAF